LVRNRSSGTRQCADISVIRTHRVGGLVCGAPVSSRKTDRREINFLSLLQSAPRERMVHKIRTVIGWATAYVDRSCRAHDFAANSDITSAGRETHPRKGGLRIPITQLALG
jgi:hypothetical protein